MIDLMELNALLLKMKVKGSWEIQEASHLEMGMVGYVIDPKHLYNKKIMEGQLGCRHEDSKNTQCIEDLRGEPPRPQD